MKVYSRLRQQTINGREKQCTMGPASLLPMLGKNAALIENRQALPGRGRFNRQDLHRRLQALPQVFRCNRLILVQFMKGDLHGSLPPSIFERNFERAQ